jgi:hypothetical protein
MLAAPHSQGSTFRVNLLWVGKDPKKRRILKKNDHVAVLPLPLEFWRRVTLVAVFIGRRHVVDF